MFWDNNICFSHYIKSSSYSYLVNFIICHLFYEHGPSAILEFNTSNSRFDPQFCLVSRLEFLGPMIYTMFSNLCSRHGYSLSQNISQIRHVDNIPTMQFFSGISRNTQSKSYMLSLTECVRDFQNNALWDTH